MKLKKYLFIILLSFISILSININKSKASSSDLYLKSLDYNVNLNSDGTAFVTETWDIDIEDTNTLFKTFKIDKSKYSGIINVSLIETTKGINKPFTQIYQEKYHVDKNCFYALVNSKGEFEIAWGVHEDDARRTFKISYTIVDAVKNFNDCSEFYWQFISNKSEIPAKSVSGTITLPNNVINLDDLRVWAHGPLNGNIYKTSNNNVRFELSFLNSRTMLETRIVTPTYVFSNNSNKVNENKLNTILVEEQKWADEANRRREEKERQRQIVLGIIILIVAISNIAGIYVCTVLVKNIKKYKKELEKAPNIKPTFPSKYYRDIPNENSTPAQAAFLYYFKKSMFSMHIPNIISATILDLAYKKYLKIDLLDDNKKEIKITLFADKDKEKLSSDEKVIYELLEKVSKEKEFTMKQFEKYCKNYSSSFSKQYTKIEPNTKSELEKNGLYDKTTIKIAEKYCSNAIGYFIGTLISPIFMIICFIPFLLCTIYSSKLYSKYSTLTQKGTDEKEAFNGLKNFMDDFSTMDKKEIPELVLWEKYLIYATAFGISDKVLKDLKVVYPQIMDSNYMASNDYIYLYLLTNNNLSNNFVHSINNSVISSFNYSSGSGAGGGFSSGGGFGGGGGRNGRKIK